MTFSGMGDFFTRICFLLLGLMLVAAGGYKLYSYGDYRFRGNMAYGIVDHPSSGRGLGGRPLIQYTDAAGDAHEFKSRAKTHWFFRPKKGEKIKIFYQKNDPDKAIAESWVHYVFFPLIFFGAGGYCCWYAIFSGSGSR